MAQEWQEWPIDKVVPYDRNPRHNDEAVEPVAASLREFGWQQPIAVDEDGVILAGHTRYKAAKRLGYKTVPVHVAKGLTPEQAQAYRLADNKTAEAATWDDALLAGELDGISSIDMTAFGFDAGDFSALDGSNAVEIEHESLAEQFGFVPFSVIMTTAGAWMERKRQWFALGIRSEIGRGGGLTYHIRRTGQTIAV